MTQAQRQLFLIQSLLEENPQYQTIRVPHDLNERKYLLRALMNVRAPKEISEEFLSVQDDYLQTVSAEKGITDLADLTPVESGIYLWQGDITTLRCDSIVNAANSNLTGCYIPCHGCIDNCIHTHAGIQLRLYCAELMRQQAHEEKTGTAKITPAFNLPCRYVLHTVGPIITGEVTRRDEELLASCYRSCLELSAANALHSIAFCCISTGEFHFPKEQAAQIAVRTVREFLSQPSTEMEVIFSVFKESDFKIYQRLLRTDTTSASGAGIR